MKAEINEYDGCYAIDLTAETVEDAAKLVRLGMNTTKELRSLESYVSQSGTFFSASCVVAKAHKASNQIPHITRS